VEKIELESEVKQYIADEVINGILTLEHVGYVFDLKFTEARKLLKTEDTVLVAS